MMRKLCPTQTAKSVHDLDLIRLHAAGKRVLIFDLDGTLCRRGTKTLHAGVSQYLADIYAAGFQVGILTNRRRNAADPIVRDLGEMMPVVSAAGKPSRQGFIHLLTMLNARPDDAVMVGDKRWTDILGANRMGIHSIRVQTHLALVRSQSDGVGRPE